MNQGLRKKSRVHTGIIKGERKRTDGRTDAHPRTVERVRISKFSPLLSEMGFLTAFVGFFNPPHCALKFLPKGSEQIYGLIKHLQ
jgi:hypothetical protein